MRGEQGPVQPKGLCLVTKCTTIEEFIARFAPYCDETSLFITTSGARAVGVESPIAILLADKTQVLRGWCVVFDAWSDANNPFGRPGIRVGLHRLTPASRELFARLLAARPRRGTANVRATQGIGVITSSIREAAAVQMPPPATRLQTPPRPDSDRASTMTSAAPPPPRGAGDVVRAEPAIRTSAPPVMPAAGVRAPVGLRGTLPPASVLADGSGGMNPVVESTRAPRAIAAEGSGETRVRETRVRETRAAGSPFILPANPLMDLTDQSLEGFVDCLLYESIATPVDEGAGRLARAMTAQPEPAPAPVPESAPSADIGFVVDTPARPVRVTGELVGRMYAASTIAVSEPAPPVLAPPPPVWTRQTIAFVVAIALLFATTLAAVHLTS